MGIVSVVYAQDNNSLPVWIILSPAHHHISINSQPFLVGIVSIGDGIAGALEVVVVLGVVLVVEMWVLELKCSDGYLVGVVFW